MIAPAVPRLSELARPFIVAVVTDRDAASAEATMHGAALDGAHAFEVNLPAMPRATPGDLRALCAATGRPVYTTCRRRAFMTVYGMLEAEMPAWDDEERMARQLAAIPLGARAIDMEMDTFDPRPAPPPGSAEESRAATAGDPAEFTDDAVAVARQRDVARRAKNHGAEVLFSCHTGRPQSVESLVSIGLAARERGADLVKIVSPCGTVDDLYAALEATRRLAGCLGLPFTLIGSGPAGDVSRIVGVNFGSSWAIGQLAFRPGSFHPQPLVGQLRETMRLIPWRAPIEAEGEARQRCA